MHHGKGCHVFSLLLLLFQLASFSKRCCWNAAFQDLYQLNVLGVFVCNELAVECCQVRNVWSAAVRGKKYCVPRQGVSDSTDSS
jgi:hypothetical protein